MDRIKESQEDFLKLDQSKKVAIQSNTLKPIKTLTGVLNRSIIGMPTTYREGEQIKKKKTPNTNILNSRSAASRKTIVNPSS